MFDPKVVRFGRKFKKFMKAKLREKFKIENKLGFKKREKYSRHKWGFKEKGKDRDVKKEFIEVECLS